MTTGNCAPKAGSDADTAGLGVSIIVVTYNSSASLPGLMTSLQESPPGCPWELIVVDNASRDRSVELIREQCPWAKVITHAVNRGFAAGVNSGARAAKGECLILANPDVTWAGEVIDSLRRFLHEHPRAAAVAPRLVYPDGRPQPSVRRFPTHRNIWFSRGSPWRREASARMTRSAYTMLDPKVPSPVEAVAAAFVCVRAEAFRAVGGMDEGYFLYVEDTDLCRRWHDQGWQVWTDPTVVVSHAWRGGAGADPVLSGHHRASIRRYFRQHHSRERLRNAILFVASALAAAWVRRPFRLRSRSRVE